MNLPETLNFTNEDERIATMENYSKGPDVNPDEITRIMNAPVVNPDPPVAQETAEDGEFEGADTPSEVVQSQVSAPAPATSSAPSTTSSQVQAHSVAPVQAPADQTFNRKWQIDEKDIPKDTYFDKKENKVRPFITQKDPQDLFKTVIHGQKRIHYLEDVLLPQEREAAAAEARAAISAENEKLKAELEQYKKSGQNAIPAPSATPVPQAPVSQPGVAPNIVPKGTIQESAASLQSAMEALKGIDKKDAIEHTDKLMDALMASVNHINNLTAHTSKIQEDTQDVRGQFSKIQEDRKTEAERQAEAAKITEAQSNWQRACHLVDSFSQTNQDFRSEFGNVDQAFGEMTKEAVNFHTQLASIAFNKHPSTITNQEQIAASQAFLKGDEKLIQAVQQYGINEPKNYRAWVELDQVDAMRTGMYRDPISKQWIQLSDPVTKKPVHLGDMETSYGKYLDITGKRQQKVRALLKQQQKGLTDALTRRDRGVVSMDTNSLGSDGSGSSLTEQQAVDIMNTIDAGRAQAEYMKTGNKDALDRLNSAFERLGMAPLAIPDISPSRPIIRKQ